MKTRICKHHGELPFDKFQPMQSKYKKSDGTINYYKSYMCKICRHDRFVNFRKKNKEKINAYHKKYRIGYRKTAVYKQSKKKFDIKSRKKLGNNYIKKIIVGKRKIRHKDIPSQLVESYRALLLLKRHLKELHNAK